MRNHVRLPIGILLARSTMPPLLHLGATASLLFVALLLARLPYGVLNRPMKNKATVLAVVAVGPERH